MTVVTDVVVARIPGCTRQRRHKLARAAWMPHARDNILHWIPAGTLSVGPSMWAWDAASGAECVATNGSPEWSKCPQCLALEEGTAIGEDILCQS